MRHQDLPEHLRRNIPNFFRRLANVYPAFESVLESSLASPPGMDLRFNYNLDIPKLTRDLLRFIER